MKLDYFSFVSLAAIAMRVSVRRLLDSNLSKEIERAKKEEKI